MMTKASQLLFLIAFSYLQFSYCYSSNLRPAISQYEEDEFVKFTVKYNKVYNNEEEFNYRKAIFVKNLRQIESHNSKNSNFSMKMTKFGDLENQEFRALLGKRNQDFRSKPSKNEISQDVYLRLWNELPESVDWRNTPHLSPVYDQLTCGSCWAFSTIDAVESAYSIMTGELKSFSKQQMLSCDPYNYGCEGGFLEVAYENYIYHKIGICEEHEFPYENKNGTCDKTCDHGPRVIHYANIGYGNDLGLMDAVSRQPVAIAITIPENQSFQFYESGIYEDSECLLSPTNHAVLVVGYGSENGTDYFIIKNSWGTDWGEEGYIRIKRGVDLPYGMCNILSQGYYPYVSLPKNTSFNSTSQTNEVVETI